MQMREIWYKTPAIKFEMIRHLYKRESSYLIPKWVGENNVHYKTIRTIKLHNVGHIDATMDAWNFFDKLYNLYYSIGTYQNGVPHGTLNLKERDVRWWVGEHHKYMTGYDFFIDIDSPSHGENDMYHAWVSANSVKDLFDEHDIPYELRFSGCGFHFIIPYEYLVKGMENPFDPSNENSVYVKYAKIARWLFENVSQMVDIGIYDSRRLCKVPHSLSVYEDEIYVCLPINSDAQFDNFKVKDYNLVNFNEYQKTFYRRGSFLFNSSGNVKLLEKIMRGEI